jgi:hypothetical protein
MISMKKTLLSLFTLFGVAMPSLLGAECIPTAPVGYTVPFSMVTLKNFSSGGSQYASYTTGRLNYTSHSYFFAGTTLSSTGNQQLFSDRTFPIDCGTFFCSQQPFNLNNADQLGVSISDGSVLTFPVKPASISVTFTLESWGNGKISSTATCDATSGELYITSPTTMYVMTFGTPEPPVIIK